MHGEVLYLFKYEMHMHTSESSACGHSTIEEMITRYKADGYSGAVLTNHFYHGNTCIDRHLPWNDFVREYSRPYFEGQRLAKELDFDLLFGIEEHLGGGKEFLVYGITPDFLYDKEQLIKSSSTDSVYRMDLLPVWADEVKKAGGIMCLAHPFRNRGYIKEPDYLPNLEFFDAVEVYNLCNTDEDNQKAAEFFGGSDKILIAGSDLHNTGFEAASGIAFTTRVRDEKSLKTELVAGNFEMILTKK